jgi:Winged helix-turn helix
MPGTPSGLVEGSTLREFSELYLGQQGQLVQTIRGRNPDQLRLPFFLWTREAVRELIRTRYGVELALTTVGQYLKRGAWVPEM